MYLFYNDYMKKECYYIYSKVSDKRLAYVTQSYPDYTHICIGSMREASRFKQLISKPHDAGSLLFDHISDLYDVYGKYFHSTCTPEVIADIYIELLQHQFNLEFIGSLSFNRASQALESLFNSDTMNYAFFFASGSAVIDFDVYKHFIDVFISQYYNQLHAKTNAYTSLRNYDRAQGVKFGRKPGFSKDATEAMSLIQQLNRSFNGTYDDDKTLEVLRQEFNITISRSSFYNYKRKIRENSKDSTAQDNK